MSKKIEIENWDGKPEFDPCSLYKYRQDWLAPKVVEEHKKGTLAEHKYQHVWEEEEWRYQNNLRDMAKVDKLNKDICVLIHTHKGHRPWMKYCIESYAKLGYFTILSYDNPFKKPNVDYKGAMPSSDAIYAADMLIMKHVTWHSGVGVPHIWNAFYATKMAESLGFNYVFSINGDCCLDKPEGFPKILEMLGDNDIICCSSENDGRRYFCGTMGFIAKTNIMIEFWYHYIKTMYHFNVGNAETRLGRFVHENNYKLVPTIHPKREFRFPAEGNEFYDIMGFRHLHAEHKHRRWERREPLEKKYYDFGPEMSFISSFDQRTLLKYWETGKEEFKVAWWNG